MNPKVTRPARSTSGCWTCRLRRKKCDETHSSCSTCVGLKLVCYGYGSRPDWMDGGVLEREQAAHVKQIVKANTQRSRRRSQRATSSQDGAPNTNISSLPTTSISSVAGWASSVDGFVSIKDDTPTSEQPFSGNLDIHPAMFGSLVTELPHDNGMALSDPVWNNRDISSCFYNQVADLNPVISGYSRVDEQPDIAPTLLETDFSVSAEAEQSISGSTPGSSTSSEAPHQLAALSIERGCEEGAILMHYLDHVFYIQFPFYRLSNRHAGRGWLMELLVQDRSVYHAALALSQYHRHSVGQSTDAGYGYYMTALRELRNAIGISHTWTGTQGLVHGVRVLTCSLFLLFLEVFRGAKGAWQMHLQAAASLVPQIVRAHQSYSISNQPPSSSLGHQLTSEERKTITILLGSFIWLDVLAGASVNSLPSTDLNHLSLLSDPTIHLEDLVGCENWVVALIFRISELGHWKRESENNCRLSISELAKRGAEIEACLKDNLSRISISQPSPVIAATSSGLAGGGSTSLFSAETKVAVTTIFALSALTYLHVVISGPIFNLPEIAESVTRTVAEFTKVRDVGLLPFLVWPFCLTGCLASEDQQDVFRDLVQAQDISNGSVGTFMGAWKVMEECWKRRKRQGNCDLLSVMQSLGHFILLA